MGGAVNLLPTRSDWTDASRNAPAADDSYSCSPAWRSLAPWCVSPPTVPAISISSYCSHASHGVSDAASLACSLLLADIDPLTGYLAISPGGAGSAAMTLVHGIGKKGPPGINGKRLRAI